MKQVASKINTNFNLSLSKGFLFKNTFKCFSSKKEDSTVKSSVSSKNAERKKQIIDDKVGVILTLNDKPGALLDILQILKDYNINLSHIRSKPSAAHIKNKNDKRVDIILDLEKNNNEVDILAGLEKLADKASKIKFSHLKNVPWFPKCLEDLNFIGSDLKVGGDHLSSDHPGFNDPVYKKRRSEIEEHSKKFEFGGNNSCAAVEYTEEETKLWTYMWDKLIPLHSKYACDEFNDSMNRLIKEKVFSRDRIPQFNEMNEYFGKTTGMFFRPTGGLLSEREFLNTLAFRVFPSTQYIRHASKPLYTPEPDIIHEFLGHAATFANKEFVEFSQEIGLASLGASNEEILRLATIYWYTVEFGLCKQKGDLKIYGGGILSSPSEIEHSVSDKCKLLEFDLVKMAVHPVNVTDIQTEYYLAPSFVEMKNRVKEYAEDIKRPFNITFNLDSKTIEVDRKLESMV